MRVTADASDSREWARASRAVVYAGVAVAFAGAVPGLRAQAPALTLAEVIELRTQGVSSRQILRSATQYCLAFTLTDSIERQLAVVGADSALVAGLRTACSNKVLPAAAPAVASDVLLDDDFVHGGARDGFGVNDRRCTAQADAKALHLENRGRDAFCVAGYPSGILDDNVRIEVTVNRLGANRQGIVVLGFGRDPESAVQYSFSVTADRRVELCRTEGGTCQRLVYKAGVAAIHLGASDDNRLVVEVRGRKLTLIVNDVTIDTYTANRVVTGALSLGVGPNTNVNVTRVFARRLSPPVSGH